MRLYYSPGSCSLAPHIVIEETGATYESVQIALAKGEHMAESFGVINPRRKVPVLELDNGQTLTEAHAIMAYLADTHPDAKLIPSDPLGRARAHEWMSWLASTVHVTFATFFRPERFLGEGQEKEPMQAAARGPLRCADARDRRTAAQGRLCSGRLLGGGRASDGVPALGDTHAA